MVCPVGNYTRVVPRFAFMIYPNVFVLMPLAAAHVSMAEPDGQVIVTPSGSLPSTSLPDNLTYPAITPVLFQFLFDREL